MIIRVPSTFPTMLPIILVQSTLKKGITGYEREYENEFALVKIHIDKNGSNILRKILCRWKKSLLAGWSLVWSTPPYRSEAGVCYVCVLLRMGEDSRKVVSRMRVASRPKSARWSNIYIWIWVRACIIDGTDRSVYTFAQERQRVVRDREQREQREREIKSTWATRSEEWEIERAWVNMKELKG